VQNLGVVKIICTFVGNFFTKNTIYGHILKIFVMKLSIQEVINNLQTFEAVSGFIKSDRFRRPETRNYFWQSPVPVKWVAELSKSPHIMDLLLHYFAQSETINLNFIKGVALSNPDVLMKTIKLSKAHLKDAHWDSFPFLKDRKIYLRLGFIRELIKDWQLKEIQHKTLIENLDYELILTHTIAYFEKYKRTSSEHIGNSDLLQSHTCTLWQILNKMLNIRKSFCIKNSLSIKSKYSLDGTKAFIENILPDVNPPEALLNRKFIPKESMTADKQKIRTAIEFYFGYHDFNYSLNMYYTDFADFFYQQSPTHVLLKSNSSYAQYKKDDFKIVFQNTYHNNKAADSVRFDEKMEIPEKNTWSDTESLCHYWSYLKLPFLLKTKNGNELDFKKIFLLLQSFSNYMMPAGNHVHIQDGEAFVMPKKPKPTRFKAFFEANYIQVLDANGFAVRVAAYFKWSESETQRIIDYLTTDLSDNRKFEIDFLSRPFLKIENQYFWLSSLLDKRAWDRVMHARIAREFLERPQSSLFTSTHQAAAMEQGMADDFKKAGFRAINSHPFSMDGLRGEFDTLSYKENTLFVIELKTTYGEEDMLRYVLYTERKFKETASLQLDKAVSYIHQNFEQLKKVEALGIDCDLKDLKVVTMIVSNIFDRDNVFFNGDHLKTSLFALTVMLRNDLADAWNMRTWYDRSSQNYSQLDKIRAFNSESNGYFHSNINHSISDLWSQKKECSALDLIRAITENKIWHFLDKFQRPVDNAINELRLHDVNQKYLV
jgi:hypothetical protein